MQRKASHSAISSRLLKRTKSVVDWPWRVKVRRAEWSSMAAQTTRPLGNKLVGNQALSASQRSNSPSS